MADSKSDHWENYWTDSADRDGAAQAVTGNRPGDHFDRQWRDFFHAHLPRAVSENLLVADIACGAGVVTQRGIKAACDLGVQDNCRFLGFDYSSSAARHISRHDRCAGRHVFGVCADATRLPLADGAASLVTSQFGIEYAGFDAFADAARILAPGGALRIIAHYRDGAIYRECHENAEMIGDVFQSELLVSFKKFAQTGDLSVEPRLRHALRHVDNLARSRRGAAATMALRLSADVLQMARRRGAFAPADLARWADGMVGELEQYRARMLSMTSAALDDKAAAHAAGLLRAAGVVAAEPVALSIVDGDPPAGWLFDASRP